MYPELLTFATAFLGSAVESVEALTIVLAVGLTRGWRYPLCGTVAAVTALGILVAAFGQLVTTRVPEPALKLTIGTLMLLFGLRWLNKAVLRSAGVVAAHDEESAFRETVRELPLNRRSNRDWLGFAIAFKGVFLEGVEVAFIVFAVGANSRNLPVAALGGLCAIFAVAAVGTVVRHPLARVPENVLKTGVGVILASLGTFWAGEGMGVAWPLDFLSVLILAALFLGAGRLSVLLIHMRHPAFQPA